MLRTRCATGDVCAGGIQVYVVKDDWLPCADGCCAAGRVKRVWTDIRFPERIPHFFRKTFKLSLPNGAEFPAMRCRSGFTVEVKWLAEAFGRTLGNRLCQRVRVLNGCVAHGRERHDICTSDSRMQALVPSHVDQFHSLSDGLDHGISEWLRLADDSYDAAVMVAICGII